MPVEHDVTEAAGWLLVWCLMRWWRRWFRTLPRVVWTFWVLMGCWRS